MRRALQFQNKAKLCLEVSVEEAKWGVVHLVAQLTHGPTSSELLTPF
jgi:hypothetical protein